MKCEKCRSITKNQGGKEPSTYNKRKTNWSGHILGRNCLLKLVIEGKVLGKRRRSRRRKQLLDDLKETKRYWKLKEEILDCAL
jgi:hypothetical protein